MLIISTKQVPKSAQHDYAHSLLRVCLAKKGIDYDKDTKILHSEMGKPSLTEYPDIHYNVTHADGITACTVGESECGIDAERVRAYRPNVIKRTFSESEKALMESTPDEEKNLLFFRLWTLKEAYVKAIGIGVSYPMNTVEFSFDGSEIRTDIEGYSFKQYILNDGEYVVSVCEKKL